MVNWKPWKTQQKKDNPITNAIGDLGIKAYTDETLKSRINMIYLLHLAIEGGDIPVSSEVDIDESDKNILILQEIRLLSASEKFSDQINAVKLKIKFMDLILRTAAIPWLRAGDNRRSSKILFGWEGMFSKSKTVITAIENILTRKDEGIVSRFMDRSELLYNLKVFLTIVPFKYGLLIADISYQEKDVTPNTIAVLYQNVINQGTGRNRFIPGDQYDLRYQIPPNKPLPERLKE